VRNDQTKVNPDPDYYYQDNPEKSHLSTEPAGKGVGLLRVWPGTCVLGFDGFQPPTPTFNGTHQSGEIQAEGNFFAMFASSGIVA